MPTVELPGSTVHYSTAGAGPALVLLHGTDGTGEETYGHVVDRFTDVRTVILPTYAGSGQTTDPGGPLTLELLVSQVCAVIHHAATRPVDLVGFSLGAQVAAALAADHPHLVRRLANGGMAWSRRCPAATWVRRVVPAGATGPRPVCAVSILSVFSADYLSALGEEGIAELVSGTSHPGLRRQIDLDLRVDLRDRLPRITVPTLVIGCRRDHLIPVAQQRRVHAAIAGSQYREIDSGHVVMQERPEEFVTAVRKFVLADD